MFLYLNDSYFFLLSFVILIKTNVVLCPCYDLGTNVWSLKKQLSEGTLLKGCFENVRKIHRETLVMEI